MTSINLHQGLSVLQPGKDLMIGLMPPAALVIEDAPEYLKRVLSAFSGPVPQEQAVALIAEHSELAAAEAQQLLDELLGSRHSHHSVDRPTGALQQAPPLLRRGLLRR